MGNATMRKIVGAQALFSFKWAAKLECGHTVVCDASVTSPKTKSIPCAKCARGDYGPDKRKPQGGL